jgi:hypothetical protein
MVTAGKQMEVFTKIKKERGVRGETYGFLLVYVCFFIIYNLIYIY